MVPVTENTDKMATSEYSSVGDKDWCAGAGASVTSSRLRLAAKAATDVVASMATEEGQSCQGQRR